MSDKEQAPNPAPPQAHRVGTVNQVDRSRQYTRTDNIELLRSLNEAWTKIRILENGARNDQVTIAKLHKRLGSKWRENVMTALISAGVALAWEIGTLFAPMLLRYLGLN